MRCPFFEEMVVAYCRAFPIKKMIPSDRLQANCSCTRETFTDCALFREIMARMEGAEGGPDPAAGRPPGGSH